MILYLSTFDSLFKYFHPFKKYENLMPYDCRRSSDCCTPQNCIAAVPNIEITWCQDLSDKKFIEKIGREGLHVNKDKVEFSQNKSTT